MDKSIDSFVMPKEFQEKTHQYEDLSGPDGCLLFVACDSGKSLARKVKSEYLRLLELKKSNLKEIPLFDDDITRYFEDGTTIPRLPHHVANSNAFVFQNLTDYNNCRTPGENFNQLLQMVRTLKVHGAKNITSVMPYLPHPRQEKPSFMKREATLAKLDADLLKVSGTNSVLTYHPHSLAIQGFYEPDIRFVYLSGLDLFIDMFYDLKGREDTIALSTDEGGVKYVIPFSEAMSLDHGITIKHRARQKKAETLGIVGDLNGKNKAIVIDDETATLSSFMGTTKILCQEKGFDEIYWGVTHMKLDKDNYDRLYQANEKFNVKEVHITDTIPQNEEILNLPFVKVHSIAERFARTINRMHYGLSVSKLFYKPN